MLANKGYPSKANRAWLCERDIAATSSSAVSTWRGIAMRSDKTARNHHATLCLAATLHWLSSWVSSRPPADGPR
jgi:hypothetical protein